MSKQEITFSDSIARLNTILDSLQGFMKILESEKMDDEILHQCLVKIAKSLNPELTDEAVQECADIPIVSFAFNEAVECTHKLTAAWGAANPPNPEKAEMLIRWAEAARSNGGEVDKAEILKNIPWMLEGALSHICSGPFVSENQTSDLAVGARMLALLSLAVNNTPGLKYLPGDDCRPH